MRKKIHLIVFLGIIISPILFSFLAKNIYPDYFENRLNVKSKQSSLEENDSIKGKPKSFVSFINKVEQNKDKLHKVYKRNLVIRPLLIKIFSSIQIKIFNRSPFPKRVILGKNGWMFLGDFYSNVVRQSKGHLLLQEEQLENIRQNLEEHNTWLNRNGIAYYVAITPNKHSIYGDLIDIKKAPTITQLDQLQDILEETNINFVDLSELLIEHKQEPLFYRTNTHWSDLGAYYAHITLLNKIQAQFPSISPLEFNNFSSSTNKSYQEDLTKLLRIKVPEEKVHLSYKESTVKKQQAALTVPKTFLIRSPYEKRYTSKSNQLKVLVFGDSFSFTLLKYLAESFGETVFLYQYEIDRAIILKEKPDIVITEMVERSIEILDGI